MAPLEFPGQKHPPSPYGLAVGTKSIYLPPQGSTPKPAWALPAPRATPGQRYGIAVHSAQDVLRERPCPQSAALARRALARLDRRRRWRHEHLGGAARRPEPGPPADPPDRPTDPAHWFARTNAHVLFQKDHGGDENFNLWCVGIDGSAARNLTPDPNCSPCFSACTHETRISSRSPERPRCTMARPLRRRHPHRRTPPLYENTAEIARFVLDSRLNLRLATTTRTRARIGDPEMERRRLRRNHVNRGRRRARHQSLARQSRRRRLVSAQLRGPRQGRRAAGGLDHRRADLDREVTTRPTSSTGSPTRAPKR